jgi:hypothetical protein
LKQINDMQGRKKEIGRRFAKWWKEVCSPKIRERLKGESAADAKGTAGREGLPKNEPVDKSKKCTCDSPPSGIDVVTSEQLFLATRLSLVTAKAARYMDVAALFQALGGGWWNRVDVEQQGRVVDAGARSASGND